MTEKEKYEIDVKYETQRLRTKYKCQTVISIAGYAALVIGGIAFFVTMAWGASIN